MPIQTAEAPDAPVALQVFAHFAPGLRDIEGFGYLTWLTQLHVGAHELLR